MPSKAIKWVILILIIILTCDDCCYYSRQYEKSSTNTYLERSFGVTKVPIADEKPLNSGINYNSTC